MHLRLVTPADAPAIAAIYAPYVRETAISFEAEPPDAQEMQRRIAAFPAGRPWLAAADNDRLLGYAYANTFNVRHAYQWSTETTVYVDRAAQRRGIGRALYMRSSGCSKNSVPARVRRITLPNDASVGLHRALGFTDAGIYVRAGYKFARWHDVGWFQRGIGADPAPPDREPLPVNVRSSARRWEQERG